MTNQSRRLAILIAGVVAVLLVAIPVLGADPSAPASSSPSAETSPSVEPSSVTSPSSDPSTPSSQPSDQSVQSSETPPSLSKPPATDPDAGKSDASDESDESDENEGVPVTVTGTVATRVDGKGRPTYTLTADGKTWELSDGPPWFWGDKNPLNAFVGKSVTIVGSAKAGGNELDVETVNGTAIRAPGKPPWAGGPWVVGPTHPGWKPWMADGKPGKGNAHGQTKDKDKDKTEP